jgi:hypothetical protein
LLTITRLVETVAERTLVLLDEPEAHLHPPLLSAFVRALSDLLTNRNGVAIIATHSPVVLQEVPKSCAWKIWRNGTTVSAERPEVETFGENVGILTREVFGLEVTHSGFHKMLQDSLEDAADFDDVFRPMRPTPMLPTHASDAGQKASLFDTPSARTVRHLQSDLELG